MGSQIVRYQGLPHTLDLPPLYISVILPGVPHSLGSRVFVDMSLSPRPGCWLTLGYNLGGGPHGLNKCKRQLPRLPAMWDTSNVLMPLSSSSCVLPP